MLCIEADIKSTKELLVAAGMYQIVESNVKSLGPVFLDLFAVAKCLCDSPGAGVRQSWWKQRAVEDLEQFGRQGEERKKPFCIWCYSSCQHSPWGDTHFKLFSFKVCTQSIFCSSKETRNHLPCRHERAL